jgi:hypothetical protein
VRSISAQGLIGTDALVSRDTVAGTQFQNIEYVQFFDEFLFVQLPAESTRGEKSPLVIFTELGGAVHTRG